MDHEVERRIWDVLVIGTGMGGATLGYALARAGWNVVFVEKGRSYLDDPSALRGDYAETFFSQLEAPQPKHADILKRAGRAWEEIDDVSGSRRRRFIPFVGCGTGGSSALYGMAMERFFPEDFETWPVSYEELAPYYEAAERLFRVRGTEDPLRKEIGNAYGERGSNRLSPPPLNPVHHELFGFFQKKGLHPYRISVACEYERGSDRTQGFLDATGAKNDSARMCLEPAVRQFGTRILTECEVVSLEATRGKVTGVACTWKGEHLRLTGRVVVLAAGALGTPAILLRSASSDWPNGLANASGLVGRNLMRHFIDLYAIFPKVNGPFGENLKEIGLNDFYRVGGRKFGTLQSFGPILPPSVVVAGMEEEFRDGKLSWRYPFFRLVERFMGRNLSQHLSRSVILASILEDPPHAENRVMLSSSETGNRPHLLKDEGKGGGGLALHYRIRKDDRVRIREFRKRMATVLKPYRFILIRKAEDNAVLGHACGTCRFGTDPKGNVLVPSNRAHGLENLYVVDASFFPTSGGMNPGLTIAANALRVAEKIAGRHVPME